jgi:AraC-like DNA-binding protein
MVFKIPDFAFFIFISLLIYLSFKTNDKNKYHLNYLKLHLSSIFLITTIYIGIQNKWVSGARFDVILGLLLLGILFLLLHVESAIKGYRAVLKPIYFIPIVLYCFICLLNYFDIYLLHFSTRQTIVMDMKVIQPAYFSDKLLFRNLCTLIFVFMIFITFQKNIIYSQEIKKKNVYSFWIYSYLAIICISTLLSTSYYFGFFHPAYDPILKNLSSVFILLSILSFSINPSILYYIPYITKINVYEVNINIDYFKKIEQLLKDEQLFLNKNLSLDSVCKRTGLKQKIITATIKENTSGNWKSYVNGYRVDYAVELIKSDFLVKYSILALGEKSGFNSSQTFFRAFKIRTGMSPAKYYKDRI